MPAQKLPQQRKSRIPRGSALAPIALATLGPPMEPPEPPHGLSRAIQEDWAVFWESPQAAHVVPSHLPALRRLFELRYQRERFAREGAKETLVTGSTGQSTLNPLLKELDAIDAKILALEDRFGLSPKHSIALAGQFDDANRAAAEANAALASGFEPPAATEPRRLAAIE